MAAQAMTVHSPAPTPNSGSIETTTDSPAGALPAGTSAGRAARQRLIHIDAMRPSKQLLVVTTHSLLAFAPASVFVGAALMLLHVAREGFLFISACMLTYAYRDLRRRDLGRFWRRRLVAVGVPYLCWTVIYFLVGLPGSHESAAGATGKFFWLLLTGYSQLYFLVVLLQFYVVFPLVAWLLRRTAGHHVALLAISLGIQVAYMTAIHWSLVPAGLTGLSATREMTSYQFYLLAGSVAALHYDAFHAWVTNHARLVLMATLSSTAVVEAWYFVGVHHLVGLISNSSDAFQPVVVPFNISAIALIYLSGVALARPRRSGEVGRLTAIGIEDSYAVYLSQMLFIDLFVALGAKHLDHVLPWPLVVALAVLVVFACGCLTGEVLARTPLSRALAGRSRARRRLPEDRSGQPAVVAATTPS